ncbi:TetR/AcrR family transcriptional regulator [Nocardia pseudovaccinii]|uniref:TetR/AcrR family transcriptional regulator n=1 Tax=Nocardia pseudovaccinii TaxID=189540 RepID=UPI0007A53ED5|nr:TetR/AcrR family transcriptional regulator [Nocardia pseudovaccinii]
MTATSGRRERKKAQTRQALADAATKLFTEHGYDNVGVREVAEAADVSLSTLFKHFPNKESLVFDLDADIEADLVAAVRDRTAGQSVIHALRDYLMRTRTARSDDPATPALHRLVESTPALREYAHQMLLRHESALATAIAEATRAPAVDLAAAGLAHFALEAAKVAGSREDPASALGELFDLLENGWGR